MNKNFNGTGFPANGLKGPGIPPGRPDPPGGR